MYLKKAIELANEMLEDKSVSESQVRNWIHYKVLPKAQEHEHVEPRGRRGVYPEDLPLRIATIAELKDYHEIKQIAKVVSWLEPLIEKHGSINKLEKSQELEEVASDKLSISKESIVKGFTKNRNKRRRLEIFWDYLEIRKLYREKRELQDKINNIEV